MLQNIQTKPASCLQDMYELVCLVKCIYRYLAQMSEIAPRDFNDFFVAFGKPNHPVSKDLLPQWVKEVMEKGGSGWIRIHFLHTILQ